MDLGISVICATKKVGLIENILENYLSQDYALKELIIILNYDDANLDNLLNLVFTHENIKLYHLPSKNTLGECLNFSIKKCRYPTIAKFDDDDYYGPLYLNDSVKCLSLDNVGIVGKATTFVYFVEEQIMGLKNSNKENKYVNRVAGSTLMFKKNLFEKIQFKDISLGEDIHFCNDCLKIGYKIYSTNRHHYVYIRNNKNKHTWKMDNQYILGQCTNLTKVQDYKEYLYNSVNNSKKTYL